MSSGYHARGLDLHHEEINEILMPLLLIPGSLSLVWFSKQISLDPTYHGADIQGQRSWKADCGSAVHARNRALLHEGYWSSDTHENTRLIINPTATSLSQFFPPLMILLVRCRILHWYLCQNRYYIESPGCSEWKHPKPEHKKLEESLE